MPFGRNRCQVTDVEMEVSGELSRTSPEKVHGDREQGGVGKFDYPRRWNPVFAIGGTK